MWTCILLSVQWWGKTEKEKDYGCLFKYGYFRLCRVFEDKHFFLIYHDKCKKKVFIMTFPPELYVLCLIFCGGCEIINIFFHSILCIQTIYSFIYFLSCIYVISNMLFMDTVFCFVSRITNFDKTIKDKNVVCGSCKN